MKVKEAIDKIFSHNEIVSLWKTDEVDANYSNRVWKGMAWDIPDKYLECDDWKIFGTIPESIIEADIINIHLN